MKILGRTIDTSSNAGHGGAITIIGKRGLSTTARCWTPDLLVGPTFLCSPDGVALGACVSGAIKITASEGAQVTAAGFANVDLISTDVKIGAATIYGGDVQISAEANTRDHVVTTDFGEGDFADLVEGFAATGLDTILSVFGGLSVIAGVAYARARAHVDIGTHTTPRP